MNKKQNKFVSKSLIPQNVAGSTPIANGIAGGLLSPHSQGQYPVQLSPNNEHRNNQVEMAGMTPDNPASAIHPALSTAIETVNQMNGLKQEIMAQTHGLVVSSTIMEDDESSEESPPSGIDLSEEFITIEDDISIDIEDIDDMNDINKKHKRKKSKNKKHKHKKYSSIGMIDVSDDDEDELQELMDNVEKEKENIPNRKERHYRADKVFGMQSLAEDKEEDKFTSSTQKLKKSQSNEKESDSDNLSELSAEQSLNSMTTATFSQVI